VAHALLRAVLAIVPTQQSFTRVHHRAISPTTTDENVGEQ